VSLRARTVLAAALLLGAWGAVAIVDAAAGRAQREAEAASAGPQAPQSAPPARGRMFVFFVDSLRGPRAAASPAVAELRARGLFLGVNATQDAATVPSLRAAFTGRTQRSIFAFVRNFVHRGPDAGGPSVLAQAVARGDRVAVFSDGSFYELAAGITDSLSNERPGATEEERQVRAFREALALFREGRHAVVVFHLTTLDHAAHTHGPGAPGYERAFGVVDGLLREAEAAVSADDTLVLMGDHGHDEHGRHFPGLDVPTIALYRGSGFRRGTTLAGVPLTLHRYLMSWALGLPLAPEYRGAGAPAVLAGVPVPAAFRAPPPEASAAPLRATRLAWLAPLALFIAGAAAFAARRLAPEVVTPRRALLGAIAGAPLFTAWGALLAHRRLQTPPPLGPEILAWWGGVAALLGVAVATKRLRGVTATWLALALPALLLYPSAAWDGWAAIMTPAWLVALLLLAVDWAGRRAAPTGPERAALGLLAVVAAALLPFFYAEADGIVSGDWSGYLSSNSVAYWLAVTVAAKAVLFVRPGASRPANLAALGAIALFTLTSFGDVLPSQTARLAAAALLGAGALAARRRGPRDVANVLTNVALLMAWRATVALEERAFLQLEILLAALRLTALAGGTLAREEDRRSFSAWLEAVALIVAAWTTLALTLHRLEWAVLYRFFPADVVERHVGLFLPVIVGRYALPLVLARRLLAEARPESRSSWRAAAGAMTTKVATLSLVVVGSAVLDPTSEPFMGAVQGLLTFSVLALALIYEPGGSSTSHRASANR
jgi:hypothetical protein